MEGSRPTISKGMAWIRPTIPFPINKWKTFVYIYSVGNARDIFRKIVLRQGSRYGRLRACLRPQAHESLRASTPERRKGGAGGTTDYIR